MSVTVEMAPRCNTCEDSTKCTRIAAALKPLAAQLVESGAPCIASVVSGLAALLAMGAQRDLHAIAGAIMELVQERVAEAYPDVAEALTRVREEARAEPDLPEAPRAPGNSALAQWYNSLPVGDARHVTMWRKRENGEGA